MCVAGRREEAGGPTQEHRKAPGPGIEPRTLLLLPCVKKRYSTRTPRAHHTLSAHVNRLKQPQPACLVAALRHPEIFSCMVHTSMNTQEEDHQINQSMTDMENVNIEQLYVETACLLSG